jgi:hypothetical protein
MFNKVADLGMTYVPYRGGAPSIPDLIAGRLHMQYDALTLLVAADQGRQAARACGSDAAALARPARRSDLARSWLRRLPGQCLGRHHGAARHAASDRQQAERDHKTTSCARPKRGKASTSSTSCCGQARPRTSPPSSPRRRRRGRTWCGNPAPRRSNPPRFSGHRIVPGRRSSSRLESSSPRTEFSSCAKNLQVPAGTEQSRLKVNFGASVLHG